MRGTENNAYSIELRKRKREKKKGKEVGCTNLYDR